MAEKKQQEDALAVREPSAVQIANEAEISDAPALMKHMEQLRAKAFVLSPASTRIAPGFKVAAVPIAIDPSVDKKSGKGAEVYYSSGMHAKDAQGNPTEVSLNKYGLLRILAAAGVDVEPTFWLTDQMEKNKWVASTSGFITDLDGTRRRVASGTVEVDARDGADAIGGWTPEEWSKRVEKAEEQKKKTPPEDRWKVKPEPINGFSAAQVLQLRKFGRQIAETKSLLRLVRNLGIQQSYKVEDLKKKPFIVYRPIFQYDMTDPEIRRMVTAAHLGGVKTLYPGARTEGLPAASDEPVSHAYGEAIDAEPVDAEDASKVETADAPIDAVPVSFDEEPKEGKNPDPKSDDVFTVKQLRQRGKGAEAEYFVETEEGKTFYTRDVSVAKLCAGLVGRKIEVASERVAVAGQTYLQILETKAAELKL